MVMTMRVLSLSPGGKGYVPIVWFILYDCRTVGLLFPFGRWQHYKRIYTVISECLEIYLKTLLSKREPKLIDTKSKA